jgi:hypothetical protein
MRPHVPSKRLIILRTGAEKNARCREAEQNFQHCAFSILGSSTEIGDSATKFTPVHHGTTVTTTLSALRPALTSVQLKMPQGSAAHRRGAPHTRLCDRKTTCKLDTK